MANARRVCRRPAASLDCGDPKPIWPLFMNEVHSLEKDGEKEGHAVPGRKVDWPREAPDVGWLDG